ncbi:MAG: hypothetical protein ACLSHX_01880 [Suilimivivens sp.]
MLDELSGKGNISYYEDVDGNVLVKFEGNDFVKEDSINEIALLEDEVTGFYTPYWKNLADTTKDPIDISSARSLRHAADDLHRYQY